MTTKSDLEKHIKEKKEAVLVVNTHSRKGRALFFNAVDLLRDRGITLTATYPVDDPVRLPEVIKEAIERGTKFIIVGGGDGTISSIVDYFAYQDIVLGLLPLGTGNNLVTRTMGIPKSVEGAVGVIVNGKVVDVDVEKDLIALHSKELIGSNYEALGHKLEDGKEVPYTKVGPTTLGIQLYAVAHNKLPAWRNLPDEDFGEFPDIKTPNFFALSSDDFLKKGKLK